MHAEPQFKPVKSWYATRWFRGAMLILAVAIILFYVEEDWRGIHAWNRFAREWAAKGEHFDLASRVPPPVPAEQNFALAPVVYSCYGQMLDRTGHEIQPLNTNLVNRLDMDIYGGNYDISNQFGYWNLQTKTDLKVWQSYYRNMAAKTNLFPVTPQPQSPAADVLLALSRYDAAIGELRQAAQLPYSRFPLAYGQENPINILLPHLSPLKHCAQVLQLRAIAELQNGQSELALDDVKLMLRLADSIRTEPFWVSHLVQLDILKLSFQPVWEELAAHQWSEAQLVELDGIMTRQDPLQDYLTTERGEMAWRDDLIRYFQRHPGYMVSLFFENDESLPTNIDLQDILLGHMIPIGWFDQNRLYCASYAANFCLPAADVQKHVFIPAFIYQALNSESNLCKHLTPKRMIAPQLLTETDRDADKFSFAQSSADMARVAIALERYRLAEGVYPDTLAALSPRYLNPVPNDVIGGKPLHYSGTGDGRFLLYSIGWNEKDDGGVIARFDEHSRQRTNAGDWVWCYPQE